MSLKNPELKPLFIERMKVLLPNEEDFQNYLDILKIHPVKSIRCNTIKISPEALKKRLEKKGWKIKQPWKNYPEVMIIEGNITGGLTVKGTLVPLQPGELGRSLEHLLGYYYAQELASMLPIIVLQPKENELFLDLCASPGSKTTQASALMKNTGTILANEINLGRLKILASNLERCGLTNGILTRKEGASLCQNLKKLNFKFDKILIDAPCSGEGTLRSSPATYLMWNIKTIQALPRIQKNLVQNALEILKPEGELIYSTCTHAPEENEGVINQILNENPNIKIQKIELPKEITGRQGITSWKNEKFRDDIKLCCRIYPQDNNMEGFFIAKLKKVK